LRRDLKWKTWLILFLVFFAFIYAVAPQYSQKLKDSFFKGQDPIRKGLDLKGGIEVILAPDYRAEGRVLAQVMNEILKSVNSLGVQGAEARLLGRAENNRYDGLIFTFKSAEDANRVLRSAVIKREFEWRSGIESKKLLLKVEAVDGNPRALQVLVSEDPANFPHDALYQAKVIISNRVNASGLAETDVRYDEKNGRIQVQLPGVQSQEEADQLIRSTGRLNFRLNGRIVMFGSDLKDAMAQFDPSQGAPVIQFEFGRLGAKQFADITSENVGNVLAMYLDEELLMEPVINEPITGGKGIITLRGGTSLEEARNYAILMKSGALPISLRTVQMTQVAPTLGSETVRQSVVAGIFGIILVILFMAIFYSLPGLLADAALVIYAVLFLGVFALCRGVLTLPGVAGLILSIGMAVDANIIILERIKDEIRAGKRMRPALEAGFDRAFWTIVDSNVTTLIVGVVLMIFGTGAVKGFAVTLNLGILISMFTVLVVSRLFLELAIDKHPDKYLKYFWAKGVK